jgi:hypothetical protein
MSAISERIAILNHPSAPHASAWDEAAVARLVELGFTAVQVNIGWGPRPADEPLNLEDVVRLDEADAAAHPQPLAPLSDPTRFDVRRRDLAHRIELCRAQGLRTAFNFGAPFNQHAFYGDAPPNCLMDESVVTRYELLLEAFHREFPVDYLWLYTYDQDAWLCSEFGTCERCGGVPLHERLVPFLDRLTARWSALQPEGRLWWEPWELSAGQVLRVLENVEPAGFGLALHNNVAECMVALAADRHVRNFARLAASRGIPVTVEGYLGAASEEVEPYLALQSPLATYRQVQAMTSIEGVTGIKEYYGLDISKEDPNLRASTICFREPALGEDELLARLSEGYGDEDVRSTVATVWRLASEAMWLYPWDASWWAREVGRSDPRHSLTAAFVRGMQASTPAWRSTRGATFMAIDDREPDPWLLEDVQLRWELCAERQLQTLELAETVAPRLPPEQGAAFRAFIDELREFRRRVLAVAYHSRETNLARLLRDAIEAGAGVPTHVVDELGRVLETDRENMGTDDLLPAIEALARDPAEFAAEWFLSPPLTERTFGWADVLPESVLERSPQLRELSLTFTAFDAPRGFFSVTSR